MGPFVLFSYVIISISKTIVINITLIMIMSIIIAITNIILINITYSRPYRKALTRDPILIAIQNAEEYSPLRNSDPSISTVSREWPDRIANMAPHVHPEKFWVQYPRETLEDHAKDPQTATKNKKMTSFCITNFRKGILDFSQMFAQCSSPWTRLYLECLASVLHTRRRKHLGSKEGTDLARLCLLHLTCHVLP